MMWRRLGASRWEPQPSWAWGWESNYVSVSSWYWYSPWLSFRMRSPGSCKEVSSTTSKAIPSDSYILPASSSRVSWGEEFDGEISFRSESSEISHSLHIFWLWVFVFVPIGCMRKLHWWWLMVLPMDRWVQLKATKSHFIVIFLY